MIESTPKPDAAAPDASAARPARAPRRAPNELTFTLPESAVVAHAADEPDWLTADRRAAFERYRALYPALRPVLHALHEPGGA